MSVKIKIHLHLELPTKSNLNLSNPRTCLQPRAPNLINLNLFQDYFEVFINELY